MPFVLLLMVMAKLPIAVPTPFFSVAFILAALLLALGILSRTSWVALIALVFTWAVECEWHSMHFTASFAVHRLGLVCCSFFFSSSLIHFSPRREPAGCPGRSARSRGVLHFALIFDLISMLPAVRNGFVPAVFIIPFAFGVGSWSRNAASFPLPATRASPGRAAAALFFLSLIFPIQFDREWITLGWALEGLALLALFRSVPNNGLRIVGTGLLCPGLR